MNKMGLAGLALVAGLGCGDYYFNNGVNREKDEMLKILEVEREGVTENLQGRVRAVYCDVGDMAEDGSFATQNDKTYVRISNVVRDVARSVSATRGNSAVGVFDDAVRSVIKNPAGDNVEVVCVAATAVAQQNEAVE